MVLTSVLKFAISTVIRRAKQAVRCREECLELESLLVHLALYLEKREFPTAASNANIEQALTDIYNAVEAADKAIRMCLDSGTVELMCNVSSVAFQAKQAHARLQNAYMALTMKIDMDNAHWQSLINKSIADLRQEFDNLQTQVRTVRLFQKGAASAGSSFQEGDVVILFYDGTVLKVRDCLSSWSNSVFRAQVKHPLIVAQNSFSDNPSVLCIERGRCIAVLDDSSVFLGDVRDGEWLALSQTVGGLEDGRLRVARNPTDFVIGKAVVASGALGGSASCLSYAIFSLSSHSSTDNYVVLDCYMDCDPGSDWRSLQEKCVFPSYCAFARKVEEEGGRLECSQSENGASHWREICVLAPDISLPMLTSAFSQLAQFHGLVVKVVHLCTALLSDVAEVVDEDSPDETSSSRAANEQDHAAEKERFLPRDSKVLLAVVHAEHLMTGLLPSIMSMTLTIYGVFTPTGFLSLKAQVDVVMRVAVKQIESLDGVLLTIVNPPVDRQDKLSSRLPSWSTVTVAGGLLLFTVLSPRTGLAVLSLLSSYRSKARQPIPCAPSYVNSEMFLSAVKDQDSLINFDPKKVSKDFLLRALRPSVLRLLASVSWTAFVTVPFQHPKSLSTAFCLIRSVLVEDEVRRFCSLWAERVKTAVHHTATRLTKLWELATSSSRAIGSELQPISDRLRAFIEWLDNLLQRVVTGRPKLEPSPLFRSQQNIVSEVEAYLSSLMYDRRGEAMCFRDLVLSGYRGFLRDCTCSWTHGLSSFIHTLRMQTKSEEPGKVSIFSRLKRPQSDDKRNTANPSVPTTIVLCELSCVAVDSLPIHGTMRLDDCHISFRSTVPLVNKSISIPYDRILDVTMESKTMLPDVISVFATRDVEPGVLFSQQLTLSHRSSLVSLGRSSVYGHAFQHFDGFRVKSWDVQMLLILLCLTHRFQMEHPKDKLLAELEVQCCAREETSGGDSNSFKDADLLWQLEDDGFVVIHSNSVTDDTASDNDFSSDCSETSPLSTLSRSESIDYTASDPSEISHDEREGGEKILFSSSVADNASAMGNTTELPVVLNADQMRVAECLSFSLACSYLQGQFVLRYKGRAKAKRFLLWVGLHSPSTVPKLYDPEALIFAKVKPTVDLPHAMSLRDKAGGKRKKVVLRDDIACVEDTQSVGNSRMADFLRNFQRCALPTDKKIASCFSIVCRNGNRYDLQLEDCSQAAGFVSAIRYWVR
jgi:hypothetical protein